MPDKAAEAPAFPQLATPAPLVTVRALTMDDLFDAVGLACEISPDPEGMLGALMPGDGPEPPCAQALADAAVALIEGGASDTAVQDRLRGDVTVEQIRAHMEAVAAHRKEVGKKVMTEIMRILPRLTGQLRERAYGWLAGLCDMSVDDYRKLPPGALPQTIRQLTEREEFPAFFEEFRALLGGG